MKMFERHIKGRELEDAFLAVKTFLKYRTSAFELSKITGLTEVRVREILTDRDLLVSFFPKKGSLIADLVQNTWQKLEQEEIPLINDLDLTSFSDIESKQYKFLAHLILTFRLHLLPVADLMHQDPELIYQKLEAYNPELKRGLEFLFKYDEEDDKIALKRFSKFYIAYQNAQKNNNKVIINLMHDFIFDSEFNNLIKGEKPLSQFTFYDLANVLNYDLKYAFRFKDFSQILNTNAPTISEKLKYFYVNKPELMYRYKKLVEFNRSSSRSKGDTSE